MKSILVSVLLCGLVSCSPVPSKEEEARGLLEDIIIGQIQNQINNILGITTTKGTPVLDIIGGIVGGETTTAAPAADRYTFDMFYVNKIIILVLALLGF